MTGRGIEPPARTSRLNTRQPPTRAPEHRDTKPLWRFGRAGRLALVCAIPVLLLAISGRNPVYETQRLVMDLWGVPAMDDVTIYGMVYPNTQLTSVAPGPFALLWILLAFGLSPRRVSPLWYAYFVSLCIATPLLHALFTLHNLLGFTSLVQALGLDHWLALSTLELLLLGAGLWRFTRSWKVFAAFCAASAAFWVPWEFVWASNAATGNWPLPWNWSVGAWHAACTAALLVWAIHARRLARRWWICKACGYDLRGCNADRCPECGAPFATGTLPEPG